MDTPPRSRSPSPGRRPPSPDPIKRVKSTQGADDEAPIAKRRATSSTDNASDQFSAQYPSQTPNPNEPKRKLVVKLKLPPLAINNASPQQAPLLPPLPVSAPKHVVSNFKAPGFDFSPFVSTAPVKSALKFHTGPDFESAIQSVIKTPGTSIGREFSLDMYSGKNPEFMSFTAAFSLLGKTSLKTKNSWTQGWMDALGSESTAYDKGVLPKTMTLERATFESQVMKKLAEGDAYVPAPERLVRFSEKGSDARDPIGRGALQSYLEEITAATGIGVPGVGSAMRAMMLASKLRMQISEKNTEEGFYQRATKSYSQLLAGGASELNTQVHKNQSSQTLPHQPTEAQVSLVQTIMEEHKGLNALIEKRFEQKWAKPSGKWWKTHESYLSMAHKEEMKRVYLDRKLQRHGITHYQFKE